MYNLPIFYNCIDSYIFWIVDGTQPKWIMFNASSDTYAGYLKSYTEPL